MPSSLPNEVIDFLRRPQHAVIAWTGGDGRPQSAATWYDWDDGEILINMDATRKRVASRRVGSSVSLTVLDADNWYRHVTLTGPISRVEPDDELHDIDRLSVRYSGSPYQQRSPRVSAAVSIESWHGWIEGSPWPR